MAKPGEEASSKQGMSKTKITHVSIITNCKMSLIFSLVYFMFWLIFLKVKKQKSVFTDLKKEKKKRDVSLPIPSPLFGHKHLK